MKNSQRINRFEFCTFRADDVIFFPLSNSNNESGFSMVRILFFLTKKKAAFLSQKNQIEQYV